MSGRSIGYAGTVERVERMRSSVNGNPRYRVHLTDGRSFPTAPDAMWAYAADNAEWRQQVCWFALEPCRLKSDDWQISYARGMWLTNDNDTSSDGPAPGRVWFVWHGGANYRPGTPTEPGDVQSEKYASDVVDIVNARYWNRDGRTPAVDNTSEAWIYASDPRGLDDAYPDLIVRRADGGEDGDGWHTWTVSPV